MDYKLALMAGVDIPVVEIQTIIHQPTIKEIAFIGEKDYFMTLQLLCFNKDTIIASNPEGSSRLVAMNDFQIFMTLVNEVQPEHASERKQMLQRMFTLLFPAYQMQFLPSGAMFFNNAQIKHNFTIDENNFSIIKNVITEIGGLNNNMGGSNSSFNPKGQRAAEIAAKIMRGRQRTAKQRGDSSEGILSKYVSILTVGLNSMTLADCLNLTVYQLYDLIERYGLYTQWDLDIRSRLAGGSPDDKPDDWMKNIH